MSKRAFEEKIRRIDALRLTPGPEATALLAKTLQDRSNYLVSKAAAVVADLQLAELVPDLTAAFERFLENPEKSDPQCWAKIAIAKALKDLGHRDPTIFLRGVQHVQMEPVFGGRQDTAGPLRSTCALALVDCPMDDFEILTRLADLLGDPEEPVRTDAALAIGQVGSPGGALLLRLKARLGDDEPGVTGQCLASLLSLGGADAVGFAAGFFDHADPQVRFEAAAALGSARVPEALAALVSRYDTERDYDLRRAIVSSAGASPVPEAAQFLLRVISESELDLAVPALEALAASRFRTEIREKAGAVVESRKDAELRRTFAERFHE